MVRETVILTRSEIAGFIDVASCVDAIESAMAVFEKGKDFLPPKIISLPFVKDPALLAALTGYTEATQGLTIKLGQERSGNPSKGLPTTASWVHLFDPETGELLMSCDGTLPTMLRTASAAAVSTRHLARKDASVLTVVGVGQLGQQCVRAVRLARDFKRVLVCDQNAGFAKQVAEQLSKELGIVVEALEIEDACKQADVIVTATNSRAPIVKDTWVKAGTHIAGMGTDLHEKIECELALTARSKRYADFVEHALLRGEVSQAIEAGLISADTCYVGSLGQLLNGSIEGRVNDTEITMYDGVGIGIQDTTIAKVIYDQAQAKKRGVRVSFDR
jgi:ornithine cyclodeaminase/alanine dehydrogenase-like protein (mu-crystallin family)